MNVPWSQQQVTETLKDQEIFLLGPGANPEMLEVLHRQWHAVEIKLSEEIDDVGWRHLCIKIKSTLQDSPSYTYVPEGNLSEGEVVMLAH